MTARLSNSEIGQFIELGFVKIENAFSEELAVQCRSILWEAMLLDPNEPATWTQPVKELKNPDLRPKL